MKVRIRDDKNGMEKWIPVTELLSAMGIVADAPPMSDMAAEFAAKKEALRIAVDGYEAVLCTVTELRAENVKLKAELAARETSLKGCNQTNQALHRALVDVHANLKHLVSFTEEHIER